MPLKKYRPSLQLLKPYRKVPRNTDTLPTRQVGFLSFITGHYLSSFVWNVYKTKNVDVDNIWKMPSEETSGVNADRLQRLWRDEVKTRGAGKASLIRVVLIFIRTRLLVTVLPLLLFVTASFIGPSIIFKKILDYAGTRDSQLLYGIALVGVLLTTEMLRVLCINFLFLLNYSTGMKLRGGVAAVMFKKILAARSLQNKTMGELVNLVANDSQRLFDAVTVTPLVFGGPFIAIAGTVYSINILGWWALAGSIFLFMFYPYQVFLSTFVAKFRRQCIAITDKRVRIMNEILTSIKLIKLYAWEKSFVKTISGIRSKERKILEKSAFTMTLSLAFNPAIPVFASVITFLGHILSGNELSSTQAFVVIGINILMKNRVINGMNFAMRACAESINSLDRLQSILQLQDLKAISSDVSDANVAVEVSKGTFCWDQVSVPSSRMNDKKDRTRTKKTKSSICKGHEKDVLLPFDDLPVLSNIELEVKKGSVCGICGTIGSGKSSLVSSILGETVKKSGKVAVDGSIAYVSQQAWIQNTTVKENILFGQQYNEDRYSQVIDICCLKPDLSMLPAGDLTEIGERGINLSGGQKQRISLARAVYCDSDIYLLDDPFAALDSHVGQEIYDRVILNVLKGKTILLITHQLQYLSQCDTVIMMKSGRIHGTGTHEELMKRDCEYAALIKTFETPVQCDDLTEDLNSECQKITENQNDSVPSCAVSAGEVSEWDHSKKSSSSSNEGLVKGIEISPGLEKAHSTKLPVERENPDWKADKLNFCARLLSESDLRTVNALYSDAISGRNSELSRSTPNLKYRVDLAFENKHTDIRGTDHQKTGKLVEAEEENSGAVRLETLLVYLRAAGGVGFTLITLLMFMSPVVLSALCTWWLSEWLQAGSGSKDTNSVSNMTVSRENLAANPDLNYYATVYVSLAVSIVVALLIRGVLYFKGTLRAASNLHDRVLSVILSSPMSFFDTTPTGRIINRFSKDLDEADSRIPLRLEMSLSKLCELIVALILVSIVFPWFLIALVLIIMIFLVFYQLYRTVVREIKRADNVSRSPMLSHLAATVQGVHTIRAFGKQQSFYERFCYLFDRNSAPFLLFYYTVRWFGVRLELFAVLIPCVTALLVVCAKDHIPVELCGLALVYSSQVTGMIQFCIRLMSETEAGFTSIERLHHYIKTVKAEKTKDTVKIPSGKWPENGSISFTDVEMRYRPDLPLVLQGITCDIQPMEKIGVVGRTGAGKSSLGIALFRLAELSSGTISIDGQDISKIELTQLRSKLSVIPQDPVLFVGTIRYNLDPFKQCTDNDLWLALEKCHVKDVVLSAEGQLDCPVVENGANFSVGERQLICMARALLRCSKILLLDEATSAIDTETDSLVQQTIREAFKNCTLLTIAHRLNTIIDSDKIMVLEKGKLVEFDTPGNLMNNPESHFYKFLSASDLIKH